MDKRHPCYEMSTSGIERSAKLNMVLEKTLVSISRARNFVRRSSCSSAAVALIRPTVRLFNKAGANILAAIINGKQNL